MKQIEELDFNFNSNHIEGEHAHIRSDGSVAIAGQCCRLCQDEGSGRDESA